MRTKQKIFRMPRNPRTGAVNKIIVEKPSPDSVWYLVIDKSKQKPLVGLKNPTSAKQVLDALADICGQDGVAQYMMEGYSRI